MLKTYILYNTDEISPVITMAAAEACLMTRLKLMNNTRIKETAKTEFTRISRNKQYKCAQAQTITNICMAYTNVCHELLSNPLSLAN